MQAMNAGPMKGMMRARPRLLLRPSSTWVAAATDRADDPPAGTAGAAGSMTDSVFLIPPPLPLYLRYHLLLGDERHGDGARDRLAQGIIVLSDADMQRAIERGLRQDFDRRAGDEGEVREVPQERGVLVRHFRDD